MPTPSLNFAGVGNGFVGPAGAFSVTSAPPDPNAAVGPNNVVDIVNTDIAVFNKSGTAIFGPVPTNTLWSGFGGGCQTNNDGDATVAYDRIADRWVIQQFSVATTPYLECVAVSQTPDPTGAYNRYSFQYNQFPDYPKLGVWPDAYYTTYNMFTGLSFMGGEVCAFDRTKMLAGQAATQQCFNVGISYGGLLPSDLDGSRLPPTGAPNTIVSLGTGTSDLATWKFHVDWTTPSNATLVGPTSLTVASYAAACNSGTCIPQAGTSQQLDSLADRLMYRLAYRNFGDHEALVLNHSVAAGSSTGVRWYELRLAPGTGLVSVFQQGTYAPDANYRWMGSIAQDQQGNMALGFSKSSSSISPQIHYTGRLSGDPAGTMPQGEGTVIDGAGSQNGSLSRWGDYSSMSIDPSDDCTFWYTNEYIPANGSFNWSTRIGSFKFTGCTTPPPPPDFTISANPNSLTIQQGSSGTSTINTTQVGSAGTVSLTTAFPLNGPTAAVNPTSIPAGGSSTLTVTVGNAVAPGTYTITVTGTEGSNTHSTTVTVTVTAPLADFMISANPTSLTIQQGSSGSSTISTTQVGSSGSVSLTVSVSPSGPTGAVNPTSVAAGNSSTLTVSVGNAVPTGNYTVTVTGTEGSTTHSTTVTVTVTVPAPDFTISASPTSLTIQQGSSGTSTINTTQVGLPGTVNLTASVSPAGPTASLFPTSISAGQPSTLTVTVGNAVATGNYTVTVTGTEGSATHFTTVTVTVTAPPPPPDFTISANPTSLTIQQGSSGTSTINTTQVGSPGTVSLTVGVSPAGPTAALNPTSVTAGNASTLTVSVGNSVATGNYTVTVTGTEAGNTHATTVTVTVTAAAGGIINGGFETGNFTGWTTAGSTAIVTSPTHGGTYAARVGSTSAFPGDSSIAQTFTTPAGGGTLTFWYRVVCTDTVTYDWATATLKDNTTSVISSVLAKTCTNNGTWVQGSAALTGGHSYTINLINHDDNYAGDPTYTLYDDVAIGPAPPPPPPNPIVNGGFETGTLSAWTSTGATGSSTTPHSGTYSARVGSASPFNGDSSIAQTFTAPAGSTTLTFWYLVVCTDTVAYDWARATLRDNTTATTTTVLPRTCSNSGVWVQHTVAVTAGHSYTITLIDHDDNYAGDPTYALYDDVSVQ
jgi:hypothetical protein